MRDSSFSIQTDVSFENKRKSLEKRQKRVQRKEDAQNPLFLLRYSIKKMQPTQTSTETAPVQIFRF